MDKNSIFRKIPKVDILLENQAIIEMIECYGYDVVLAAVRQELNCLRMKMSGSMPEVPAESLQEELLRKIELTLSKMHQPEVKPVINATGTILHTNLGRAPIGRQHMNELADIASEYTNLEFNLEKGGRGRRDDHFEQLLCRLTGAEAAMAVNNNAAAVMLALNTIANNGEVVISRGELVEIGGNFRIPEVLEQSGARLVEVGTTNKTHIADYENAVTEDTKAFLKVHTSNYRIVGFTESVPTGRLKELGKRGQVPVIEDLGSGTLIDLSKYGLAYEPTVPDAVKNGADIICFSGDKLMGGPQAGLIIGKKEYIDKMKKNPLARALRIDKLTVSLLEIILREYLSEARAVSNIPVLQLITKTARTVESSAKRLKSQLTGAAVKAEIGMEQCESQIGGGSMPLERIPSTAVTVKPLEISVSELEMRLRQLPVPVICRIMNDRIFLDMRTCDESCIPYLIKIFKEQPILEKEYCGGY